MSSQILEMKYHPAKKEVQFCRFQGETPIEIDKTSRLKKYMNEKGTFVLQDKGNVFLSDIASCFDGEKSVAIRVITTKNDYEDLEQMVEYYNSQNPGIRIDTTLLAELPDMEEAFDVIKKYGERSSAVLKKHRAGFFDVLSSNSPDIVKSCVDNFSGEAQIQIDVIEDKIKAMGENNVNLCFAGVFSAGKSALINAILGYAILPEAISSETSRMFRIQSPVAGEPVRVVFSILSVYSEIVWSEKDHTFFFTAGPTENAERAAIQEAINQTCGSAQHIQLHNILKTLNKTNGISSEVKVYFKIPLDSDKVQYTIYDTPGTDSNYIEHTDVLMDALKSQTHSILIFVVAPTKLEGEGNNVLLNYLNKLEHETPNTGIDLGRSLFVMNWADSIATLDARQELPDKVITSKDDPLVSIRLSDKKLFFTGAKQAYAAAAKRNGIAGDEQEYILQSDYFKVQNPTYGRYYRMNHCALSEVATKRQLEASETALEKALESNDPVEVFHICSGLYALENEIRLYGTKYAAAVKAFAMIDSVDKALYHMKSRAESLETDNQKDIGKINAEIETLRTTLNEAIGQASAKIALPPNKSLPKEILKELSLDSGCINAFVQDAKSQVGHILKKWFFDIAGMVNFKPEHKEKTKSILNTVLKDYLDSYAERYQKTLKAQRDAFQSAVLDILRSNGGISSDAKHFIAQIKPPEIPKPDVAGIAALYDDQIKKSFIFGIKQIDKDKVLNKLGEDLKGILDDLSQKLEIGYRNTHAQLVNQVRSEFEQNLAKYSVMLKAKLDDRAAIEALGKKISNSAEELRQCQNDLEAIIWRTRDED